MLLARWNYLSHNILCCFGGGGVGGYREHWKLFVYTFGRIFSNSAICPHFLLLLWSRISCLKSKTKKTGGLSLVLVCVNNISLFIIGMVVMMCSLDICQYSIFEVDNDSLAWLCLSPIVLCPNFLFFQKLIIIEIFLYSHLQETFQPSFSFPSPPTLI